jgi:hypothetical protein
LRSSAPTYAGRTIASSAAIIPVIVWESYFRVPKMPAKYVAAKSPTKIIFVPFWNSLQNKIKKL